MDSVTLRKMQLNMLDAVVERIKKYDNSNAKLEQEIAELDKQISQNKDIAILSDDKVSEVATLVDAEVKK